MHISADPSEELRPLRSSPVHPSSVCTHTTFVIHTRFYVHQASLFIQHGPSAQSTRAPPPQWPASRGLTHSSNPTINATPAAWPPQRHPTNPPPIRSVDAAFMTLADLYCRRLHATAACYCCMLLLHPPRYRPKPPPLALRPLQFTSGTDTSHPTPSRGILSSFLGHNCFCATRLHPCASPQLLQILYPPTSTLPDTDK